LLSTSVWTTPVSAEPWIGWDLGGAHLKAVRLDAGVHLRVVQVACPLWLGLDRLEAALDRAITELGAPRARHAVTMTGELADLFADRRSGVASLIGVMRRCFSDDIRVYAGADGFLDPEAAVRAAEQVASANWLAAASWLATRLAAGLLVDVGSTTTDLVPFAAGRVLARGYSDHRRLAQEELVYTGVVRTPVMAVSARAPVAGHWVRLMAERFATMADVYRLTGDLPEHADLMPTADGREKTPTASARRLARMVGLDAGESEAASWRGLARYLAEEQLRALADACHLVCSRGEIPHDAPIVGAGVGRFLAVRLASRLERPYIDFGDLLPPGPGEKPDVADCAPAAAVASLASSSVER
jgi:probable H4MPT-linked C1 transfer pathway protein